MIGERLKEIRKISGYNQLDFANILGISRTHISSIENGKDNPSSSLIRLICIKFNINEEWLINGTGSPTNTFATNSKENRINKYNDSRISFEQIMRNKNDKELVHMVKAFSDLVAIFADSRLESENSEYYLQSVSKVIDAFYRIISSAEFLYSSANKKDNHKELLKFKLLLEKEKKVIDENITNSVSAYLKQYDIDLKI